ncbi:MAG: hypothetical protein WCE54_13060 [Ignavibacteriaceae bacterium]
MIFINQKQIVYCFLFMNLFISCSKNDNPIVDKNTEQVKLEIISSDRFIINRDSTVYQHNSNWHSYLDTNAYDSLANLLKGSELEIDGMWCPNEEMHCKIPYTPGMEIIVKLKRADTLIYNYGFKEMNGEFPVNCYNYWRYYKYIYN